jgi:hypothetical protein
VSEAAAPSRHLLIAGTGRAGTSFLVRYLHALGLDTHIARHGDGLWDEAAQAGLENLPVGVAPGTLPYVVKSPWLTECIDQVLDEGMIAIDAVVVPVRDLAEATTSRLVLERQAIQRSPIWATGAGHGWGVWSGAPGGALYSLHPLDQARILALGFHHLIQRLVAADIPVVLLDFPRMVDDGDYLFARLRPVLPAGTSAAQARAAHAAVADPARPRIAGERADGVENAAIEVIALRRSLVEQRMAAQREGHAADGALAAAVAEGQTQITAAAARLTESEARTAEAVRLLAESEERHRTALAVMRASSSWRLTAPVRAIGAAWRRLCGRATTP